ncbi:MAG: VOC family protein [Ignavibacteriaceae bacterium]|nr:VOC family protein [Ignavibacterium sp.]MCC6255554.1 VOC family protein [Ignavibacteriaceae bacterium]HRN26383.1 VOC family protein [Ignavibacteriaceae bacterium]HRP92556.1 VOC family protein [Ignavibacteriaceae bacterium]HRQ54202.1 VOC family protein [Ignavibacteriaceae bacterium]
MKSINPYLNFPGNTEEAFNFYKKVFGGDFLGGIFRFKDTPEAEKMNAADKEKIMHVALPMGKSNMIMATDALESMGFKLTFGNNFYISIDAESKEEADKLFNALSEGGKIEVKMADQFWGDYFGSLADKFGVRWMINYAKPK